MLDDNDRTEWWLNEEETQVVRTQPIYDERVQPPSERWHRVGREKVLSVLYKNIEEVDPAEVGFVIV